MRRSKKVWLDCDTGHDDAFAILLCGQHPSINLLGISTSYGNADLARTTHNSLAILKAISRQDVPVYPGAAKPFCRDAAAAADIHGESGLDGTSCLPNRDLVPPRTDHSAVEAMYKSLIAQQPGTAYLVVTGALTNCALLFSVYPSLVSHIAGLSIMGGAIGNGFSAAPMGTVTGEGERFGNCTPFAEFNIWLDPESALAIFSNKALTKKTTLVPLDLTHQFLAEETVQRAMLYGFDAADKTEALDQITSEALENVSLVRRLFYEILVFFAKTYKNVFALEAPPLHDVLAVSAVIWPEMFHDNDGERYDVDVVTEGTHSASDRASQCGRTIATLLQQAQTGVRIPRALDEGKMWEIVEECLARAEQAAKGFQED